MEKQESSHQEFAVEVSSLRLLRGDKLLFEKMTWQLPKGKFLAITGSSGAGKSSLLACFGKFFNQESGIFSFHDTSEKNIGIIFQDFRLTENLSVLTNVLCGKLNSYKWWQTLFSFAHKERINAFLILKELGLEKIIHRKVRQISGGELQRTAIARVLLQNPKIILADEPTSNLDKVLANKILNLLKNKCKEENSTIIAVLHDSEMVRNFADFELKIGFENTNGWSFCKVKNV